MSVRAVKSLSDNVIQNKTQNNFQFVGTHIDGGSDGSLQFLFQGVGLLLDIRVRLAEVFSGLLQASLDLLQSLLGLAVSVTQL